MSLLTCRKIAVLKFTVFALHEEKPKGVGAHFTSSEKASSVPGRMHTAVVESSGAANPRVPVLKLTVQDLRREPLEVRKQTLASLLRGALPGVQFNAHLTQSGDIVFRHACKMGLRALC